jgi:hypothetical protein
MSYSDSGALVPSGKFKGLPLSALTDLEVHQVWSGWNGVASLKRNPFFQILTAENDRRKGLKRVGKKLSDLDRAMNLASGMSAGDVRMLIRACQDRLSELESVRAVSVKRHKRSDADWAQTHNEWRSGDRVEWVEKGVSMEGRETEDCPFS